MTIERVKVIGLGGIGCALLDYLPRYLSYSKPDESLPHSVAGKVRLVLVDGKQYEMRKAERQSFSQMGNKANIKCGEIARAFENLSVRAIDEFVTPENITSIIQEGDVVFLGVDNHKTRKLVSDYCQSLQNVVVFSGGNELTDGNVQIYVRENGVDIRLPLTEFHKEINNPADKSPHEMSCQELAEAGSPQLLFVNAKAAIEMLCAFYNWQHGKLCYDENYFDITLGKTNPKDRSGVKKGGLNYVHEESAGQSKLTGRANGACQS